MACSFCPYPLKEDKKSKLAFDEIKKIINQIDPNDKEFKYITFSQFNEPLLDNRIFEIIEYAQSCGFKVLMITNGLLLNKEKNIEGILRLKPDVKISDDIVVGIGSVVVKNCDISESVLFGNPAKILKWINIYSKLKGMPQREEK